LQRKAETNCFRHQTSPVPPHSPPTLRTYRVCCSIFTSTLPPVYVSVCLSGWQYVWSSTSLPDDLLRPELDTQRHFTSRWLSVSSVDISHRVDVAVRYPPHDVVLRLLDFTNTAVIAGVYKRLLTLSTYRRYTNNCIYLSVCLSVSRSVGCLSVYLSLSLCLSIYLSTKTSPVGCKKKHTATTAIISTAAVSRMNQGVGGFSVGFFFHLFWKRVFQDNWHRLFFPDRKSVCHPTVSVKASQSTDPQPVA